MRKCENMNKFQFSDEEAYNEIKQELKIINNCEHRSRLQKQQEINDLYMNAKRTRKTRYLRNKYLKQSKKSIEQDEEQYQKWVKKQEDDDIKAEDQAKKQTSKPKTPQIRGETAQIRGQTAQIRGKQQGSLKKILQIEVKQQIPQQKAGQIGGKESKSIEGKQKIIQSQDLIRKYRSIFITRTKMTSIINHKTFDSLIIGALISYKSLSQSETKFCYHVGQIIQVISKQQSYSISTSFKTKKVLKVKQSPTHFIVLSIDQLSNHFPTKEEFQHYITNNEKQESNMDKVIEKGDKLAMVFSNNIENQQKFQQLYFDEAKQVVLENKKNYTSLTTLIFFMERKLHEIIMTIDENTQQQLALKYKNIHREKQELQKIIDVLKKKKEKEDCEKQQAIREKKMKEAKDKEMKRLGDRSEDKIRDKHEKWMKQLCGGGEAQKTIDYIVSKHKQIDCQYFDI